MFDGVYSTLSVVVPADRIVPDAGVYVYVPPLGVPTAFSCVADSAVPYVIAAGVAHVIVGVAWLIVSVPLTAVKV